MTGRRVVSPEIETDIHLKQAWACAELNDCDDCRHRKNCQKIDDKKVNKMHEPVRERKRTKKIRGHERRTNG